MYNYLVTWLQIKADRRAVTAMEYGLIAALIAGGIVLAVTSLGTSVTTTFSGLATKIGAIPK